MLLAYRAADANDDAQFAELKTQGELTRRAWERNVQVRGREALERAGRSNEGTAGGEGEEGLHSCCSLLLASPAHHCLGHVFWTRVSKHLNLVMLIR